MTRLVPTTLLAAALAPAALAQVPLTLDATYGFGRVAGTFEDACGSGDQIVARSQHGELTFLPDGTFAMSGVESILCEGGSWTFQNFADQGTYTLSYAGELVLDFAPGPASMALRTTWDREVLVNDSTLSGEAASLIGIRRASGLGDPVLSGDYATAVVDHGLASDSTVDCTVSFGDVQFDGAGGFASQRDWVTMATPGGGGGTANTVGAYQVSPDGRLAVDGGPAIGAVTADGRIAFTSEAPGLGADGALPELAVLVRKGGAPTAKPLQGGFWTLNQMGGKQFGDGAPVAIEQLNGRFEQVFQIGALVGSEVEISTFGASNFASNAGYDVTVGADGSFGFGEPLAGPYGGWLAATEEFAVVARLGDPTRISAGFLLRRDGTLVGDTDQLSLAAGGTQTLTIRATSQNAGSPYLTLGSFTGTQPGFAIDGEVLPLQSDSYLQWTLTHPNSAVLAASAGVLDATGRANPRFQVPAGADPSLAGLAAYHAALVLDVSGPIPFVSLGTNAVPCLLVP